MGTSDQRLLLVHLDNPHSDAGCGVALPKTRRWFGLSVAFAAMLACDGCRNEIPYSERSDADAPAQTFCACLYGAASEELCSGRGWWCVTTLPLLSHRVMALSGSWSTSAWYSVRAMASRRSETEIGVWVMLPLDGVVSVRNARRRV